MANEASQRLCERLNALLAESRDCLSEASYFNGSTEVLEANLRDAIEAELQPDAVLARGIATALRSSLINNDINDSVDGED